MLSRTLPVGQSFGWRRHAPGADRAPERAGDAPAETWRGVIGRRAFELRQAGDGGVEFRFGRAAAACAPGPLARADAPAAAAAAAGGGAAAAAIEPKPRRNGHEAADGEEEDARRALSAYFRLDKDYLRLHESFKGCDARYSRLADYVIGCRTLEIDPVECLLSFICSSNNNIARISKMVDHLRASYGDPVLDVPWPSPPAAGGGRDGGGPRPAGADAHPRWCHTFPTLRQLERATEEDLRENGFGYRAKFIVGAVRMLNEGGAYRDAVPPADGGAAMSGEEWLLALRRCPEKRLVTDALEQLPGIGPKVARCVSLFSLDDNAAIPVDTHVWQLTEKYYADLLVEELGQKKGAPAAMPKTLTPRIMESVEVVFRKVFGEYAGWAHNALFIAELPMMQAALPEDLRVVRRTPVKKGAEGGKQRRKKKGDGEKKGEAGGGQPAKRKKKL